ncbi:MAG TPA: rhodanese-like domain-containing protein, partial [Lacipirellulaceae bacterium]|nr:rhodanese-like domain-containing protein [Lacipirellulaceae bacterium]
MVRIGLLLAVTLAPGAMRQPPVEFTEDSLEVVQENVACDRAVLVDVRGLEEWNAGHIEGSLFVPVTSLRKYSLDPAKLAKTLPPKKEKKILYTFCVVGMRARQAARILEEQGYVVRALDHRGHGRSGGR